MAPGWKLNFPFEKRSLFRGYVIFFFGVKNTLMSKKSCDILYLGRIGLPEADTTKVILLLWNESQLSKWFQIVFFSAHVLMRAFYQSDKLKDWYFVKSKFQVGKNWDMI